MQVERSFNLNEANSLLPLLRNRMGRIVKIHRAACIRSSLRK